jgi:hypothetical protein
VCGRARDLKVFSATVSGTYHAPRIPILAYQNMASLHLQFHVHETSTSG